MRIAFGSDEATPLTDAVVRDLRSRGHEVVLLGPPAGEDMAWAAVGEAVARAVAGGGCAMGILCCWTGTGVSIAANKVAGVRAALCGDAETARGARLWNDANVLCLSLRLTTEAVAREILDAWFGVTAPDGAEAPSLERLGRLDEARSAAGAAGRG
jgi:ribose 5-phosphate isomerase B